MTTTCAMRWTMLAAVAAGLVASSAWARGGGGGGHGGGGFRGGGGYRGGGAYRGAVVGPRGYYGGGAVYANRSYTNVNRNVNTVNVNRVQVRNNNIGTTVNRAGVYGGRVGYYYNGRWHYGGYGGGLYGGAYLPYYGGWGYGGWGNNGTYVYNPQTYVYNNEPQVAPTAPGADGTYNGQPIYAYPEGYVPPAPGQAAPAGTPVPNLPMPAGVAADYVAATNTPAPGAAAPKFEPVKSQSAVKTGPTTMVVAAQKVVYNEVEYYYYAGKYYRPAMKGTEVVYRAVATPDGIGDPGDGMKSIITVSTAK